MAVKQQIGQHFEVRDLGVTKDHLDWEVERDQDGSFLIHLQQRIA
jgi:hypothetical protein